MARYKLSIVIPSWNCSCYIGEMLDSIIANTFQDWRCYVIDDQSTDSSAQVIQSYHDKDERIILKVRDRGPKGAPTCRNIGLDLSADAEYIVWFDADDMIAPYCLEQRVAYMEKHRELDFGIFPAKTFKDKPWEVDEYTGTYGIRYGKDSLQDMLKWCLPMVGWTNIYRISSLLHFNHRWDERLLSMQDSDFNISAMIKGMKYGFAWDEGASTDYFYRMIQKSSATIASKIPSLEHLGSHLYFLEKNLSGLDKNQRSKYKEDIECYLFKFATIFIQSEPMYRKFLGLTYLRSNCHLWFSLFVFFFFTYHYPIKKGKYRLYRLFMNSSLQKRWDMKQNEWFLFMRSNAHEALQRFKNTEKTSNA